MTIVDLFSGCGGLSLGFQNAGFETLVAFDIWQTAVNCYSKNFNHPVIQHDLSEIESTVEYIRAYSPDIIVGGPPCQDFSHAGKRVEAKRAGLTESYATIIATVRPKYFVMENVDRALTSNAFKRAKEIFQSAGYGLTMRVLDASLCGAPQKRKRFFCIGALNKEDDFFKLALESNIQKTPMTLRDYFGDALGIDFYYRHPRNYSRRAIFSIDESAPTMRGVNRPVPKGYPGHPNDACALNNSIRALTTLERALIQTFPPTFKWCGSKTEIEQMIGNAVPVKLAEFVAKAMLVAINASYGKTSMTSEFVTWLQDNKGYTLRTAKDMLSRVKRADKLQPIVGIPEAMYLHILNNNVMFCTLSVQVRSQLRRAINMYNEYLTAINTING